MCCEPALPITFPANGAQALRILGSGAWLTLPSAHWSYSWPVWQVQGELELTWACNQQCAVWITWGVQLCCPGICFWQCALWNKLMQSCAVLGSASSNVHP